MSEITETPVKPGDFAPDRRNELALIRTDLANERTLLAYIRTSLMMAGTGGTLIKFFSESRDMLFLGIGLLIVGGLIFATGIVRFRVQKRRIALGRQSART